MIMTAVYLGQILHFLWEKQLTVVQVFLLKTFPSQPWRSLTTLAAYGRQRCRGTASGAQTDTAPLEQKAGGSDVHLWLNCLGSNTPEASEVLISLLGERAGMELEVGSSQCPANPGLCCALLLLSKGTSGWSHAKPPPSWEPVGMHCFSMHSPCAWERILLLGWWQKS